MTSVNAFLSVAHSDQPLWSSEKIYRLSSHAKQSGGYDGLTDQLKQAAVVRDRLYQAKDNKYYLVTGGGLIIGYLGALFCVLGFLNVPLSMLYPTALLVAGVVSSVFFAYHYWVYWPLRAKLLQLEQTIDKSMAGRAATTHLR